MKKGCFFGGIIFLTIAIGIGFYLYKRYFPEIKSYGKEKLVEFSMKEIDKKIDGINETKYKDSLKVFINNQINKLKENDFEDPREEFGRIINQVQYFIKDGEIDSVEFVALKNMAIKNERPKKDRN